MPRLGLFPIIQLLFASSCRCYCHALKLTSLLGSQFDAAPPGGDDSPNDAVSDSPSYGVDCSFPIQHDVLLHDGPFDHEERRLLYDGFMKGCIAQETAAQNYESRCDQAEAERIATNLFQPSKMVNYTQLGYEKVPIPGKLLQSLKLFWKKRHQSHRHHPPTSNFEIGTTYINHWHTHFHIMNVDDELYQSKHLRTQIWDETKPILEKWTGVELSPSSMFGVSIFTDKTVVPHRVESLPFVISAIIHVADDLDTPWPIELYGHDGKAHNVTLDVGEMLLYESASVITGRPYPLQGRHYAEIFISFEPFGYSCHHEQRHSLLDDVAEESLLSTLYLDSWWMWALGRFYKAHKAVVPTYIDKNFDAYSRWYQSYPRAKLNLEPILTVSVHTVAAAGELNILKAMEKKNPDALFEVDENGWTALHEAVRGGHLDVVEYLLEKGLDINERTHHGEGGSPLWWAKKEHGKNHEIVKFLEEHGAVEIAPNN